MKKEEAEIEDVVRVNIENLLNELSIKKDNLDCSSLEQKYVGSENNHEYFGMIVNTIKKEIKKAKNVTAADLEKLLRDLNTKKNIAKANNIEGLNICFADFEVNL